MNLPFLTALFFFVLSSALMGLLFSARRYVGARWLVLFAELLLLNFAIRRFDDMAQALGYTFLNDLLSAAVSLMFVATMLYGAVNVWQRRREIRRMEAQHDETIRKLEADREAAEKRSGTKWEHEIAVRMP